MKRFLLLLLCTVMLLSGCSSTPSDTEKQTNAPVTGESVIGEQTVPSSDAATDKHAETEPAPRTNLPLRFALSA